MVMHRPSSTTTETVMRTMRLALLSGAAALIFGGCAGMAEAGTLPTRVLTIRLPDGRIERVRYTGDVPPTVIVDPEPMAMPFGPAFRFGTLDQISAAMDREADILLHDINAMTASDQSGFGLLSGVDVCMRNVQVTFTAGEPAPHVVSRTSGDCGPVQGGATPAEAACAPCD